MPLRIRLSTGLKFADVQPIFYGFSGEIKLAFRDINALMKFMHDTPPDEPDISDSFRV
jgi:hypothetical protein